MPHPILVPSHRSATRRPTLKTRIAGVWHSGRRAFVAWRMHRKLQADLARLDERLLRDVGLDRARR